MKLKIFFLILGVMVLNGCTHIRTTPRQEDPIKVKYRQYDNCRWHCVMTLMETEIARRCKDECEETYLNPKTP
jgi:hypothetical protein